MKKFNSLLSGCLLLCASYVLFSCKKQVSEPLADQMVSSAQSNNATQCRPVVFGAYSYEWHTLAQKWYENGKVKYLKAKHPARAGTFYDPILDIMFDLNWGEISYAGNQVYLKDVLNNHLKFRVTLDNQGRPVASYYDYSPGDRSYMRDTTYFYYDGDRLDYVISLYGRLPYDSYPYQINRYRKFVFSYDLQGNLVRAESPGDLRLNLQYDYTKPVSGIMTPFNITSSLKLLEYLELIELPMHHAMTRTSWESFYYQFSEFQHSEYENYIITDGLVRSYDCVTPYRVVPFYNGWECNPGGSVNVSNKPGNAIDNLKQFQQLYP